MPEPEQKQHVEENQRKVIIFITTETDNEAKRIANVLLTQKKAACVNIVARVSSSFWWQGKVDNANESLLIIKTKEALLPQIVAEVKKIHTYQVPEILAIPIVGGNEDCLKWMDEVTTPPKTA